MTEELTTKHFTIPTETVLLETLEEILYLIFVESHSAPSSITRVIGELNRVDDIDIET